MDFSPNLNLPFLLPNQAQKHVTANQALLALDATVQISVVSRAQTTPPPTPANGIRYIPSISATGAWSGLDNQLVCYQDGTWIAYTPQSGWFAWIEDETKLTLFDGTAWIDPIDTTTFSVLGINASADAVNKFTVKSPATLFDHDGNDHRLKINKAGSVDTASIIFQDNYTGYAEIGLLGQNNLDIKVSADGISFISALNIRATDGFIGMGTNAPDSQLHIRQDFDARLTIDTMNPIVGGGFDILNSGSGQNWRVTGQSTLFKIRDDTAGLNKLTLKSGAQGDIIFENCGNVGIVTANSTANLHVNGTVRIGSFTVAALPRASTTGAGTLAYTRMPPAVEYWPIATVQIGDRLRMQAYLSRGGIHQFVNIFNQAKSPHFSVV